MLSQLENAQGSFQVPHGLRDAFSRHAASDDTSFPTKDAKEVEVLSTRAVLPSQNSTKKSDALEGDTKQLFGNRRLAHIEASKSNFKKRWRAIDTPAKVSSLLR